MKHRMFFSLLGFLLFSILPGRAQELPFRAGLRMAIQVPAKKASRENVDSFLGGGAEAGYAFGKHFELDGGVEYLQGGGKTLFAVYDQQGTILDWGQLTESALSGLVSLRYRLWDQGTPYFGLGAGGSRLTWKIEGYKESANGPLLELFAGYEFAHSEHFRLDLDLRFRSQKADVDWGGVPSDLSGFAFSAGTYYAW
jgi:opacity protein-like surface antigen